MKFLSSPSGATRPSLPHGRAPNLLSIPISTPPLRLSRCHPLHLRCQRACNLCVHLSRSAPFHRQMRAGSAAAQWTWGDIKREVNLRNGAIQPAYLPGGMTFFVRPIECCIREVASLGWQRGIHKESPAAHFLCSWRLLWCHALSQNRTPSVLGCQGPINP